jgi:hypothetical protein
MHFDCHACIPFNELENLHLYSSELQGKEIAVHARVVVTSRMQKQS